VHYGVTTSDERINDTMVCVWLAFAGATRTSEHTVFSKPAKCYTDLAGEIPLDTDVYGAYLISATAVQLGASLINEETRLSTTTEHCTCP
jgi:hypothetical protein